MANPVLIAFNKKDTSLSDGEFLQLAEDFAKKHNKMNKMNFFITSPPS